MSHDVAPSLEGEGEHDFCDENLAAQILHLASSIEQQSFVPRRRETIRIADKFAERSVSIDLDLSGLPEQVTPLWRTEPEQVLLLPIAMVQLGSRHSAQVFDGDGRSLPILTAAEEREIVFRALAKWLRDHATTAVPEGSYENLWRLLDRDGSDRETITKAVQEFVRSVPVGAQDAEKLEQQLGRLVFTRLLIVACPKRVASSRQVLTYRTEGPLEDEPRQQASLFRRALALVGKTPTLGAYLMVPNWPWAASYHVEVAGEQGIEFLDVAPTYYLPSTAKPGWRSVTPPDQRRSGQQVHVHLRQPADGLTARLSFTRGVEIRGLYRAALVASFATAMVFAFVAARYYRLDGRDLNDIVDLDASTSLLLVIPGFAGSLAFQQNENHPVSALLWRTRNLMLAAGVCNYTVALGLALRLSAPRMHLIMLVGTIIVAATTADPGEGGLRVPRQDPRSRPPDRFLEDRDCPPRFRGGGSVLRSAKRGFVVAADRRDVLEHPCRVRSRAGRSTAEPADGAPLVAFWFRSRHGAQPRPARRR